MNFRRPRHQSAERFGYSAVDAIPAEYRLRSLRKDSEREWQRMDVLVVPSAPTIYTHEEVATEPVRLNTNLGYYTKFSSTCWIRQRWLRRREFGATVFPLALPSLAAFSDESLLALADRYHRSYADVPDPQSRWTRVRRLHFAVAWSALIFARSSL